MSDNSKYREQSLWNMYCIHPIKCPGYLEKKAITGFVCKKLALCKKDMYGIMKFNKVLRFRDKIKTFM